MSIIVFILVFYWVFCTICLFSIFEKDITKTSTIQLIIITLFTLVFGWYLFPKFLGQCINKILDE